MLNKISVSDVLFVHDKAIFEFGGASGVLNMNMLESAVNRMDAGFGDLEFYPSVFEKVAALFESLCRNHCFVDGNKRTASVAARLFLRRNGLEIKIREEFVLSVAEGKLSFDEIGRFFKENAK
jgi:death on curing protein